MTTLAVFRKRPPFSSTNDVVIERTQHRDLELAASHQRKLQGKWRQIYALPRPRTRRPKLSATRPPIIVLLHMLPVRARFIIFSHCSSSVQPHQS